MPAARFVPFLTARPLSLASIDQCRQEFAVSITAAGRRAIELTDASACLFVGENARTLAQIGTVAGTPQLMIVKWWDSAHWPFRESHLNLTVSRQSLIGQAFVHQDHRSGKGGLGMPFRAAPTPLTPGGTGIQLTQGPAGCWLWPAGRSPTFPGESDVGGHSSRRRHQSRPTARGDGTATHPAPLI